MATHPSDVAVAFAAPDATVHLLGPDGERTVPFADFLLRPGSTRNLEQALKQGELVTAVETPAHSHPLKSGYLKVRDRQSYEFALTSAAVALHVRGGRIQEAKVAAVGVGTVLADPADRPAWKPITYARGDADKALGSAAVRLDVTYRMGRNHHNPMEPHATIARREGNRLTLWDKTQWVPGTQAELAAVFGIPQGSIRVISPFVGGGFGGAIRSWPHVTIAAVAARQTGRPVKLVLSRKQLSLDVNTPCWMRGPGYATGSFAVESAMDELAHELGIDPIELRRRNEPAEDESNGLPFSTRRLRECYTTGAREFGWDRRNPKPRSTRDGDWLIGTGMAAGVYHHIYWAAQASVRLNADGTALVEAATSDMGPGTYTSMSQLTADALGLTMRNVTFRLGDSRMPLTPPHGGSMTMAMVGSAVQDGCDKLRKQAIELAVEDEDSPLYGADADTIVVRGGRLQVKDNPARGETYQRLLARNHRTHLDLLGSYTPEESHRSSAHSYGAVFVEVGVDARLGLVRVRRMLGVYDVGRIISPKLADSQALGGMVGGIGQALLEHTVMDHRDGRIVNADLAGYLVPVNADIADLKAIYLDGEDYEADPLGVKGIGEVVQLGVAAALANAVFHATGRRIRELPITAEVLL
ncbi:CO/xanthine dehydrogenase Mo-binding subunit [Streptomyces sp. V4I23]|uniref:molybdopterin cofactor-binding domain-containing protein n=1 Tax=Streptomyces sp. V4I23 TaxID=3042282 RepID=UPI0027856DDC|nr:molybdopterin cofactor-binding domain-containing protein [Streptomyces sp. V4I23]MDQ1007823.1 CO/xanthine dehydrogenase Mo-binding subunit [Streptomyces sp. V4I23]